MSWISKNIKYEGSADGTALYYTGIPANSCYSNKSFIVITFFGTGDIFRGLDMNFLLQTQGFAGDAAGTEFIPCPYGPALLLICSAYPRHMPAISMANASDIYGKCQRYPRQLP